MTNQDGYMRKKIIRLERDNKFLNNTILDLNEELGVLKKEYGWMFEVYNELKYENYDLFNQEK
jgi:hypothetical protein